MSGHFRVGRSDALTVKKNATAPEQTVLSTPNEHKKPDRENLRMRRRMTHYDAKKTLLTPVPPDFSDG